MALLINGERIEDALIDEEFRFRKDKDLAHRSHGSLGNETSPVIDDEALLLQIKTDLTRKALLRQEALKSAIKITELAIDEEIKTFHQQLKQNDGLTPLNQALPSYDEKELRKYFEIRLKIKALLERIHRDVNPIEKRHIRIFYESNREHYQKEKSTHLLYLAWICDPAKETKPPPPEAWLQKIASIQKNPTETESIIYALIEKMAQKKEGPPHGRKDSAPPALFAGDLGLREEKTLDPAIKQCVRATAVKTISKPLLLENVWYVFFIARRLPARLPALSELQEELHNDLTQEIRRTKEELYIAKLIKKSTIVDQQYF